MRKPVGKVAPVSLGLLRCAATLLLATGTLPAQTTASQGSIEGTVFNAQTGAPLKRAQVRLMVRPSPNNRAGGAAIPAALQNLSRETDSQGKFEFTALPPGRYLVFGTRAQFLNMYYGGRRPQAIGTAIVLTQDQHVKNIDLRLPPQGVILGRVVDEDGDPVDNVQIRLFRMQYQNGKKQWTQAAQSFTSDVGEYRAVGLLPGRYLVSTMNVQRFNPSTNMDEALPRKPETTFAATYYPNVTDQQAAVPVDVGAGAEVRGIDIRMAKVQVFHVRGTVTGAVATAGRGGISINLQSRAGDQFIPGSVVGAVQNDNRFEFSGVPPGSYVLTGRANNAQESSSGWQPLEVGSAHVTGVVLTLAPPFDLTGQVTVAEADAKVKLQNLAIVLRQTAPPYINAGQPGRTADDGRFTMKGVSNGHFAVTVNNTPDGCFVQKVKFGSQEFKETEGDISGPGNLEIILSNTAAKVTGSVVDKDGKPVENATVVLLPPDGGAVQTATTDENGAYTFSRLRPATYKLLAWEDVEPGAYEDAEFRKPYDSNAIEVKLGPSDQQSEQLHVISIEDMAGH